RRAYTQRWDGTTWKTTATPFPTGLSSQLRGVSCATTSMCVAVGIRDDSAGYRHTLIEQWNGTDWSIVTGGPDPKVGELYAVSCTGVTDCVAVGRWDLNNSAKTLVEHFDGTTWSDVASPNPTATDLNLQAVSCTATDDCTAVGVYS